MSLHKRHIFRPINSSCGWRDYPASIGGQRDDRACTEASQRKESDGTQRSNRHDNSKAARLHARVKKEKYSPIGSCQPRSVVGLRPEADKLGKAAPTKSDDEQIPLLGRAHGF